MASAQVLANYAVSTRKQEHLEAGKRRLEEFRKKKAADRAKKAAPETHLHSVTVDQHDNRPLDNQHVRLTDLNGAVPSDGVSETVVEPSQEVTDDGNKENMFVQKNELVSDGKYAKPPLQTNEYNAFSAEIAQAPLKDQEFDMYNASQSFGSANVKYSPQPQGKSNDFSISSGASPRHAYGIANSKDQSVAFGSQVIREIDDGYGSEEALSSSHAIASDVSSVHSGSFQLQNKTGFASTQTSGLTSSIYQGGRKLENSVGHFGTAVSESTSTRSRPSFLDSINMPRVPITEPERVELFSSKVNDMGVVMPSTSQTLYTEAETTQSLPKLMGSNVPSGFEHSTTSAVSAGNGQTVHESSMERKA